MSWIRNNVFLLDPELSFFQRVTSLPASQQQLFKYVASLGFQDIPDYDKCRAFFKDEMKQSGGRIDLNLSGGAAAALKSPVKSAAKKSPVMSAPAAKLSPVKKAAGGLTSRDLNGARQASPSPLRAVRKRKPVAAAYSVRHVPVAPERDFVAKRVFV
jgi:hypothetical protein